MGKINFHIWVFALLMIFSVNKSSAQINKDHVEVALRMIGHTLLLQSDEYTARVLPITAEENKFRINFASDWTFEPNRLISITDSIFKVAKISNSFRVEVQERGSKEVVYSYEFAASDSSLLPCLGRDYPKSNYSILISLLDDQREAISFEDPIDQTDNQLVTKQSGISQMLIILLLVFLVGATVGIYWWRSKPQHSEKNSNQTWIGKYQFDQRNMKLILNDQKIDLTSKETDLLALLHASIDETIEREKILEAVWGDEGDYVGRTLDVFISKLRKKFSEDENVRIVNVRGVGYRLMLSEVG